MRREYFGQAGHFIGADSCRFHIHTHVNGYCVSTVGDYHPRGRESDKPTTIGWERTYETMVFRLKPDGSDVESLQEIEMRPYNDRDAANVGHEQLCCKYAECAPLDKSEEKT